LDGIWRFEFGEEEMEKEYPFSRDVSQQCGSVKYFPFFLSVKKKQKFKTGFKV